MRTYHILPDVVSGYPLDTYEHGWFGVIVPYTRTNLVPNPSVELAVTGYAAISGSIARTTAQQCRGAYSLEVTPTATSGTGASYGAGNVLSLTSGVTYAISVDLRGRAGVTYSLSIRTTGGVLLAETQVVATGRWQRPVLFYTETSSASRLVYMTKVGTDTGVFYIDGLQVEACGAEGVFATTYIDGDQVGLVPNQFPPPYLWNGTPHSSTSTRSAQTRAGGRVMKFSDFGFLLTAIIGLGLAPPQHAAIEYSYLDGAQYQRTRLPPRQFVLTGRFSGRTPRELMAQRSALARLLSRNHVGTDQPLVLTYHAFDGDGPELSEAGQIVAIYQDGLSGNTDNLLAETTPITFTQYLPIITTHSAGGALNTQDSISNANAIVQRTNGGQWAAVGTGVSGGNTGVYALLRAPNGLIYVGGDFTDGGGSGADYLATYNPTTGAWAAVSSDTAFNAEVFGLALTANGDIIVVGNFTNAGGIANADSIVRWDGTNLSAIGTGANSFISAVAIHPVTGDIYVGGAFTDIGGSGADHIAVWDGASWSDLGGDTALNADVLALAFDPSGRYLYVGGEFTGAGGVANTNRIAVWDTATSTWGALGTGIGVGGVNVRTFAVSPSGTLYAGGAFSVVGGVSASNIAAWNGVQWQPLGTGVNDAVERMAFDEQGNLHVGGIFTTAGGITMPDSYAIWNGATWITPGITLPGTASVYAVLPTGDTLYLGFNTTGTAVASGVTTITNPGTARVYPTVVFRAQNNASGRIYRIANLTTGRAIYFDYSIQDGEILTLTLTPDALSFISSYRGNITSAILPGSNESDFFLQPGENTIVAFLENANAEATIQFAIPYESLDDLVLTP
jgi:hypothetical protein